MTSDELKEEALLAIVQQLKTNDFEAKINAAMVLSDLIESGKNFNEIMRGKIFNASLLQILYENDDETKRSCLSVLINLYQKFPFYIKEEEDEEDSFGQSVFDQNKKPLDDKILPEIN